MQRHSEPTEIAPSSERKVVLGPDKSSGVFIKMSNNKSQSRRRGTLLGEKETMQFSCATKHHFPHSVFHIMLLKLYK